MVNTREIAEGYRLSHWAQVMRERTESGLSIKAYCKELGICGNTYFYWQRRVRAAAADELGLSVREESKQACTSFSEVRIAEVAKEPEYPDARQPGQLHLTAGGVEMTVDSAYPVEQLASLLQALSRPC